MMEIIEQIKQDILASGVIELGGEYRKKYISGKSFETITVHFINGFFEISTHLIMESGGDSYLPTIQLDQETLDYRGAYLDLGVTTIIVPDYMLDDWKLRISEGRIWRSLTCQNRYFLCGETFSLKEQIKQTFHHKGYDYHWRGWEIPEEQRELGQQFAEVNKLIFKIVVVEELCQ